MYKELYQYFLLHRELQLPGIGTFLLERQPAEIDIANRGIIAPSYSVALHHGSVTGSRRLYQWLASLTDGSESDAVIRFNDFVFGVKKSIQEGNRIDWTGLGTLSRGLAGEIRFEPATVRSFTTSIPATKVLRENADHLVRVGEQDRTSTTVVNVYQPETEVAQKSGKSWILIVLLIIAAISFIGYYFSVHGVAPASAGSRSTINPASPAENSRNIP
ncbi:MAG: hypothetical protein EOO09_08615 [Chitinophagaceae bacterium]|nr:MAG: hypothetical protein EOO09_08615 [Chitinophagaceae bacterium]